MANKIDKKATIGGILQIVLTPFFILILGTLFSLLTGYVSNDNLIIVRIAVWSGNLLLSWIITTAFLKIFFRRKILFLSYKLIFFAYTVSVFAVWLIGFEDDDYSYVVSYITIITIIGAVWGIKLLYKKRGRPSKAEPQYNNKTDC